MKFVLTCVYPKYDHFTGQIISENGHKITHEFEEEQMDEILENVEMFLRGCGFYTNGILEFSSNEDVVPSTSSREDIDPDGRC